MRKTKKSHKPLWRRAYSQDRAASYAELLKVGMGPYYSAALAALSESAMRLSDGQQSLRILDLGAGTGNVTERLLKMFPSAEFVCLDGSPDMLRHARERFRSQENVKFEEKDFSRSGWANGLGIFDIVVSLGAIHHLTDKEKGSLFSDINRLLSKKGLFICGDPLKGGSKVLDRLYEDVWVGIFQEGIASEKKECLPAASLRRELRRLQSAEGDKPSTLSDQLYWLKSAGFKEVDCFWKHFGFVVFGGMKVR